MKVLRAQNPPGATLWGFDSPPGTTDFKSSVSELASPMREASFPGGCFGGCRPSAFLTLLSGLISEAVRIRE